MYDNSFLKQLNENGFVVSKVQGKSMWPLLNEKHTSVYISKADTYIKHDCILFLRHENRLILHRILKVKDNYYIVSGDNQYQREVVYPDQVVGKLIEFYKKGKTKKIKGFKYQIYVLGMHLTRPIRFLRDKSKQFIKKVFRI